ncbi:MAG: family transporter, partial [Cohnella sp.]|nr:family transporter [Cohnella sp.]
MSTAGKVGSVLRFLLTCWKVNVASALEYRLSFFLLAGMMFINNFMWLFFWTLFFHRFPVIHGWRLEDVMMLWAVGAGGFGWANVLFGNFHRIASVVSSGQLDVYLSQPKPVLLNVLASRMSVTAAGD